MAAGSPASSEEARQPSGERRFGTLLDELAARTPSPAGGVAAGWTGAIAAALVQMSAAFAGDDASSARAAVLRVELLGSAEEDRRAALSGGSEPMREIARAATEIAELAAKVAAQCKPAVRADAVTAGQLAQAAAQAAAAAVEFNEGNGTGA